MSYEYIMLVLEQWFWLTVLMKDQTENKQCVRSSSFVFDTSVLDVVSADFAKQKTTRNLLLPFNITIETHI